MVEVVVCTDRGSIPAHAGEPIPPLTRRSRSAVYPRPRGGTGAAVARDALDAGLSPPTRGNPSIGTGVCRV